MALQIAPTLPVTPPPSSAGPAAPAEPADEGGFARMLKGETARPAESKDSAEATTEPDADAGKPPAADREPGHDEGTAAVDPAIAHWLAHLHLPQAADTPAAAGAAALEAGQPAAGPAGAGNGGAAGTTGDGLAPTAAAGGRPGAARGLLERGAAEHRGAAARETGTDGKPAAAAAEPREAGGAATPGVAAEPAHRISAAFELPATAHAAAAGPAPAVPTGHGPLAPTPVDAGLPMGPGDAGFGEAFATQVSVLARDGVQQAQLHLNPAETGPVSVQIVLDGTQARIDFGADALPTRQAIEHSLPELAAALREQGLTLSGGGVSEHAGGRQGAPTDAGEGSQTRRGGDTSPTGTPAAARSVRLGQRAGGLDLYA